MSNSKAQTAEDFSRESDYDLIGYMALRAEDQLGAEDAWAAFYKRHVGYLFGVLNKKFPNTFDDGGLEDFVTQTLVKVLDIAETFEEKEYMARHEQRAHVRAWLGRIAENILLTELRKQEGLRVVNPDDDEQWDKISFFKSSQKERQSQEPVDENRERRLEWIQEAFAQLDDREEEVLRTTAEYERPGRDNQRLPNEIAKQLRLKLNTSSDNVRQIRYRAKKKIMDYVSKKEMEFNKERV